LALDIATLIDIKKEKIRLHKEISNLDGLLRKTESLLENKNFAKNAPKEVIEQNKSRLKEYKDKMYLQKDLLKSLERI
jgi:valyl-tRNA synthetase